MERQTIRKALNGTNIAKDTTSLQYMSSRPFEPKTTMKDASFSSYLRPQPPPKPEDNNPVDDSDQISVFEAENYFSGKDQHNNSNKRDSSAVSHHDKTAQQRGCEFSAISRLSSVSSTDGYGYGGKLRVRSFHATPTASSEASWNSQTGLLSKPEGSIPISLRNMPSDSNQRNGGHSSNGTKWFSGLKCPCYGKNSVQVEENLSEPKKASFTSSASYPKRHIPISVNHYPNECENQSVPTQDSSITKQAGQIIPVQVVPEFSPFLSENHHQHRRRRHHHHQGGVGSFRDGVGFSFPILNQSLSKAQVPIKAPMDHDPPRESLEVFQPLDQSTEDGGSDASSDLFEIESFSTSVAATECYAPSEASINWSVTTAEGFDRGSVTNFSISASEFGDVASNMGRQEAEMSGGGGGCSKRRSGGGNGGGMMLSCRWEKAVSVGPTQQQGKWGHEDGSGGGGGGGGRRVVGGGGGPPLPQISTMRHVGSRPYKR